MLTFFFSSFIWIKRQLTFVPSTVNKDCVMINGFRNECQTIGHDFIFNSTKLNAFNFYFESISMWIANDTSVWRFNSNAIHKRANVERRKKSLYRHNGSISFVIKSVPSTLTITMSQRKSARVPKRVRLETKWSFSSFDFARKEIWCDSSLQFSLVFSINLMPVCVFLFQYLLLLFCLILIMIAIASS